MFTSNWAKRRRIIDLFSHPFPWSVSDLHSTGFPAPPQSWGAMLGKGFDGRALFLLLRNGDGVIDLSFV